MPIIDKVSLVRTGFGHQWSRQQRELTVRFIGKSANGADCSPWPLAAGARHVITPRQVHSNSVRRVPPLAAVPPADALATRVAGIALLVVTADCVPLLAFDGLTAVAIHAGWRGVASSIVPRTLRLLDRDRDWRLWLGPHIGGCCYEVGDIVAKKVSAVSTERAVIPLPGARPHLDLRHAILRQAALEAEDRVTLFDHCTSCDADKLWSYRRDGPGSGRNLAVIMIPEGG